MKPQILLLAITVLGACASHQPPAAPEQYRDAAAYREARARLIADERARRLDAALVLTPEEEKANESLMALKRAELDRSRDYFPPARSFLLEKTKQLIAASPVFEVMKRLPKGAVLHAHGGAMGDFRWLVSKATYRPDAYINVNGGPTVVPGLASPGRAAAGRRLASHQRAARRRARCESLRRTAVPVDHPRRRGPPGARYLGGVLDHFPPHVGVDDQPIDLHRVPGAT